MGFNSAFKGLICSKCSDGKRLGYPTYREVTLSDNWYHSSLHSPFPVTALGLWRSTPFRYVSIMPVVFFYSPSLEELELFSFGLQTCLAYKHSCCSGFRSSAVWHCIAGWVISFVEEGNVFIFFVDLATLNMKATLPFETLGSTYQGKHCHIWQHRNPRWLRCQNQTPKLADTFSAGFCKLSEPTEID